MEPVGTFSQTLPQGGALGSHEEAALFTTLNQTSTLQGKRRCYGKLPATQTFFSGKVQLTCNRQFMHLICAHSRLRCWWRHPNQNNNDTSASAG
eukprot:4341174-Amphidinium_carterae.1